MNLKALTGTAKQKSWGEVIRMRFLVNMTASTTVSEKDVRDIQSLLGSVLFKKASFGIERRNDLDGLQMRLVKAVQLKEKASTMHAAGESKTEEYRLIANQYYEVIDNI